MYMMNCIEGYVEDKYYDKNLGEIWDNYTKELEEINQQLENRKIPALEEYKEAKLELLNHIKKLEHELELSKRQLKELNSIASLIKK